MKRSAGATVLVFGLCAASCDESQLWHAPHVSEERMQEPKYNRAYSKNEFFADQKAMRTPPEGAVPRGEAEPPFQVAGRYVERIPVQVTPGLMDLGQRRFRVTCAACHGVLGDGDSVVATKMPLRKPTSLHEPRIVALEVGRLYEVVRDGYGFMGSYTTQLPTPEERWAVVAYVRALQLSQGATVSELPADVRAELARRAP